MAFIVRPAGSFCGSMLATASKPRCGCGATRQSGFCPAPTPHAPRMLASIPARSIFVWPSSMTRRRSTPRSHASAGCCSGKDIRFGPSGVGPARRGRMPWGRWLGDHLAKLASFAGRGSLGRGLGHHINSWNELVAAFRRRLLEGLGSALVLVSFLLLVALLTYHPGDPSLNTASAAGAANFLGRDGALVADLFVQGFGLAAFLIPVVLLGWAFRLLLQRPFAGMGRRILWLPPVLMLGALACSILRNGPIPTPAGVGGAVGSGLLWSLRAAHLGVVTLPVAMGAASL